MNEFMDILDKVEHFDLESQSIFVDIINKRYNQNKRDNFIEDTIESIKSINSGNFSTGSSNELFKELNI
jgi:hypothetical protein